MLVFDNFSGFLTSSSLSSGNMSPKKCQNSDTEGSSAIPDTRIEDGKLLFEKRWYRKIFFFKFLNM